MLTIPRKIDGCVVVVLPTVQVETPKLNGSEPSIPIGQDLDACGASGDCFLNENHSTFNLQIQRKYD